jgi:hypothetical protein
MRFMERSTIHLVAKAKPVQRVSQLSQTINKATLLTRIAVIDNSERVIASNVFEEQDFPSMTSGRVALLGDGKIDYHISLAILIIL